jgi:hypothetical protein
MSNFLVLLLLIKDPRVIMTGKDGIHQIYNSVVHIPSTSASLALVA